MRTLPAGMQERLDSGATTLCQCWRVVRPDGVTLGFTDHDEALRFEGVDYEALAGAGRSAVQARTGLAADSVAITGALSSDAITEDDIAAGRYDGSRVELWLVDWTDTDLRLLQFAGDIGEISRGELGYVTEVVGLAERLNRPVGRSYLRTCDAGLGDARCGVDISDVAVSASGAVTAVLGNGQFTASGLNGFKNGWFARGLLTWTDGPDANLSATIKDQTGDTLALWLPPHHPIEEGRSFTLVAGCDKRFRTCRKKFSNGLNFQGFPDMPGDDWLVTVPRSGRRNNGGSRGG